MTVFVSKCSDRRTGRLAAWLSAPHPHPRKYGLLIGGGTLTAAGIHCWAGYDLQNTKSVTNPPTTNNSLTILIEMNYFLMETHSCACLLLISLFTCLCDVWQEVLRCFVWNSVKARVMLGWADSEKERHLHKEKQHNHNTVSVAWAGNSGKHSQKSNRYQH